MARKEVIQYFDDLDHTPLNADSVHTVKFSYTGTDYVIDLSADNAERLNSAFAPWVDAATRVGTRHLSSSLVESRHDLDAVRRWARENNFMVSRRGRVARKILDAYDAR